MNRFLFLLYYILCIILFLFHNRQIQNCCKLEKKVSPMKRPVSQLKRLINVLQHVHIRTLHNPVKREIREKLCRENVILVKL